MTAVRNKTAKAGSAGNVDASKPEGRHNPPKSPQLQQQPLHDIHVPAAGAHAASHLTNEDATPGAGALPGRSHTSGKEVDGGAG